MTKAEYHDQPPSAWFVLDVMKRNSRGRDWVALMIDMHPDDLRDGAWPRDYHECWVQISGKHRSRDAAYAALQDMIATRH